MFGKPQEKNTLATGKNIEQKAGLWLKAQGLVLIEYNYRCRAGEIDIIMRDGQQLIFVEVRYRKHSSYGGAAASVDWKKQKKLQKTALHYLCENKMNNSSCRFDVVAAQASRNNTDIHWSWIKNAFIEPD